MRTARLRAPNVCYRLAVLRAAHEPPLTQAETARLAKLGAYRYGQIERGDGPPTSLRERCSIADVFGVRSTKIVWPWPSEIAWPWP